MRIDGLDHVPFVLGHARFSAAWAARSPLTGTVHLEVLDDACLAFFRLLAAGNALAYGEQRMPAWVQFDVATLPTATCGFALPRADVPEALWRRLAAACGELWPAAADAAATYEGLVPVSEFCALPTPEPGTFVGISLFSLLPGRRLGVRAKALGLLLSGARRQVGVTRREGPVRRAHETFGPLRVLRDRPAAHPTAGETFVYELKVPGPDVLEQIVRTGHGRPAPTP